VITNAGVCRGRPRIHAAARHEFWWGVRHCLQSTGHIFLLHRGQHRLVELDPSGNFVGAYGDRMFERA
jgi:hypothetical protein